MTPAAFRQYPRRVAVWHTTALPLVWGKGRITALRLSVRAVQALALLIGFYVLAFGVLAGLVAADIGAYALATSQDENSSDARLLVPLFLVTGTAFYVVLRAVFVSNRGARGDVPGVPVTPEQQPALWERARFLAREAGTRPPKEIRIVADVNAGVTENARLLGLIPGRRILMVGAPLLMGLTPGQLDAVLAHEFGHYSNRDTRLLPVVNRGRTSLIAALHAAQGNVRVPGRKKKDRRFDLPGQDAIYKVFHAYALRYFAVTEAISRAQEYAADRISARVAGPRNAIDALAEMPALDAAYGFYLRRFVTAGLSDGLLPHPELALAGFADLLADPDRGKELAEIRENPPVHELDRFDSHPPMPDRIAAIRALPAAAPVDADLPAPRSAVSLLVQPEALFAAVAVDMFGERGKGARAVGWDEIAANAARRGASRASAPLRDAVAAVAGNAAGLSALLDLADAGRLGEVLDRLPRTGAAKDATGRVAREFAKNALADQLPAWVLGELEARGRAGWTSSWGQITEVVLDPQLGDELSASFDALLAVHIDAAPLRAVLVREGIVP